MFADSPCFLNSRRRRRKLIVNKFVLDQLRKAAELYEQRNAVYGDNYIRFGHVMAEMFPDGLTIKSPHDWNRIGVFVQIMSKITRYSANYDKGGHEDSMRDAGVYSTMMRELDQKQKRHKFKGRRRGSGTCGKCGRMKDDYDAHYR